MYNSLTDASPDLSEKTITRRHPLASVYAEATLIDLFSFFPSIYLAPPFSFGIKAVDVSMAGMKQLAASVLILIFCLAASPSPAAVSALNVGLHSSDHDTSISVNLRCSRKCESQYCALPPLLRYGKYCGLLYSGCPGEPPCDDLDRCCMEHDACIQIRHSDYLNVGCNEKFLDCITAVKNSGRPSFPGSTCSVEEVVDVISVIMEAAILAGRVYHRSP